MNLSRGKLYLIMFYHLKVIVTLPLNGEEINTVDSEQREGGGANPCAEECLSITFGSSETQPQCPLVSTGD